MAKTSSFHTNTYRPQTQKKLTILRKYMGPWIDIWSAHARQSEWYIVDAFAGSGVSNGATGIVSGSSLVFLEEINKRRQKLEADGRHIHLVLIEMDPAFAEDLESRVSTYIQQNKLEALVSASIYCGDCNEVLPGALKDLGDVTDAPALVFVDPCNTDIAFSSFEMLLDMPWREDVLFNYMVSAVKRDVGCMLAGNKGHEAAAERLAKFFGAETMPYTQAEAEDPATLASPLFCSRGHKVVVFYMEYPDRREVQYYLMFGSKNDTVSKKIAPEIFAKEYTDRFGQTSLFGVDDFLVAMKILEK